MEKAYVNGIVYDVIAESPLGERSSANDPGCRRLVMLRRPNGTKERLAKDYGPHPVYGENRRYVILNG